MGNTAAMVGEQRSLQLCPSCCFLFKVNISRAWCFFPSLHPRNEIMGNYSSFLLGIQRASSKPEMSSGEGENIEQNLYF